MIFINVGLKLVYVLCILALSCHILIKINYNSRFRQSVRKNLRLKRLQAKC